MNFNSERVTPKTVSFIMSFGKSIYFVCLVNKCENVDFLVIYFKTNLYYILYLVYALCYALLSYNGHLKIGSQLEAALCSLLY